MRNKLIMLLVILSSSVRAEIARQDSLRKPRIDKPYFRSYYYDTRSVIVSPFHPTKRRLISYGVAATALGIAFSQDANVQRFSQDHRTSRTDWMSDYVLGPLGRGDYSMSMLTLVYASGAIFHNDNSKRIALLGIKTYFVSALIARAPKYGLSRARPNTGDGPSHWFAGWGNNSFVSGHTTVAFSIATILALEYRKTIWVPILAYSTAAVCGYSRISVNKHWTSDVTGGALLGYGIASLIYRQDSWGVYIVPDLRSSGNGMSLIIPLR